MKNKKKLRTLLLLALYFLIAFGVYALFLKYESMVGTILYLVLAAGLTLAYYIVNRGFGQPITDPDQLPKEWSAKKKCDYVAHVTARHEKARLILYVLLPVVLVLMLDMINIFVLDNFRNLFS